MDRFRMGTRVAYHYPINDYPMYGKVVDSKTDTDASDSPYVVYAVQFDPDTPPSGMDLSEPIWIADWALERV